MSLRLLRPFMKTDGVVVMVSLHECCCDDRRGPEGGVCGSCGCAILDKKELFDESVEQLNRRKE